MSSVDNEQDLFDMKNLLTSWNVEMLYNLFKEEDITIEELKMMQLSHAYELLRNCKMGVKIRFEYHFKNWRNKIGLPLNCEEIPYRGKSAVCCFHNRENMEHNNSSNDYQNVTNSDNNTSNDNNSNSGAKRRLEEDIKIEHVEHIETEPALILSPFSIKSEPYTNQPNKENLPSTIESDTVIGQTNEKDNEEEDKNALNALADILSNSNTNEVPPKFPSKATPEKCPVTLAQILQLSGSRGMSIVKFYKEKKHLTNVHRTQLIQTIVEFFDEHDYHLSLNVSHNLEWEILKMFPTEKLEYYRTEKRGKIYVKHCNNKRYKRERNTKVRTEMESVRNRGRRMNRNEDSNQFDGLVIENDAEADGSNYGDWTMAPEPEIEVREDNLSE